MDANGEDTPNSDQSMNHQDPDPEDFFQNIPEHRQPGESRLFPCPRSTMARILNKLYETCTDISNFQKIKDPDKYDHNVGQWKWIPKDDDEVWTALESFVVQELKFGVRLMDRLSQEIETWVIQGIDPDKVGITLHGDAPALDITTHASARTSIVESYHKARGSGKATVGEPNRSQEGELVDFVVASCDAVGKLMQHPALSTGSRGWRWGLRILLGDQALTKRIHALADGCGHALTTTSRLAETLGYTDYQQLTEERMNFIKGVIDNVNSGLTRKRAALL